MRYPARILPPARRRRGSALLMVLILSLLLLVSSLTLWSANSAQEGQFVASLPRVQAEFLAKGAHQLALLKARFLAQQLYDASDYAVGKNPFYPHSRESVAATAYDHLDGVCDDNDNLTMGEMFAAGPAFFTPREEDGGDIRDLSVAGGGADANAPFVMDALLARFRADLADQTIGARGVDPPVPNTPWGAGAIDVPWVGQPSIRFIEGDVDPVMGGPDPYSGSFEVRDMRILGGRDNQIHTEDAMLVVAAARVATTVAGEASGWELNTRRVYKMRRCLDPGACP